MAGTLSCTSECHLEQPHTGKNGKAEQLNRHTSKVACETCHTERWGLEGAKIYPFNAVTVDWFVKKENSAFDDVIIVPEVKAADSEPDLTVTVEEMRQVYRKATLKTADMNFSISHSVVPASDAFKCNNCHGRNGYVLDWKKLGYANDPNGGFKKGKKFKK